VHRDKKGLGPEKRVRLKFFTCEHREHN
jgi:hypothetical protein